MDIRSPPTPVYRFGGFRLDAERLTLTHEGAPVIATPRVIAALLYLVEHVGEVCSRDEMLRALWPGRFADEANLSQAISAVRKALADDIVAEWILTIPGKGYRFVGPVEREPSPVVLPASTQHESREQPPVRKPRRVLLAGAVIAVAVLAAGGWLALRHLGAAPVANPLNVVMVAAQNGTGEPVFDHVVSRVLFVDLGQSPMLDILSDAEVAQTLKLMNQPADRPLSAQVARDVCMRRNGGAVVSPTIARLGSSYLITLSATDCFSGRSIFEGKASAAGKEQVAGVLDDLSGRLRAKLGEGQASIVRFSVPIMAEKTASFDALAAYSEGVWLHNQDREVDAIAAFQHAVDLDPNFAMAYDGLYGPLYVTKQTERARAAMSRAYVLRDTVSDRDRLLIASHYHFFVQKDLDAALGDLRLLSTLYPLDVSAWSNLSNVENWLGDYPAAVAAGERALKIAPDRVASYSVLARALNHDGQIERAFQINQAAVRRGVAGGDTRGQMIGQLFELGHRDQADGLVDGARGTPLERDALLEAFDIDVERGEMRRANAVQARAVHLGRLAGIQEDVLAEAAAYESVGLMAQAKARIALTPADDRNGDYYEVAAWVDDPAEVQAALARALARAPHDTLLNDYSAPLVRAILLWRRGDRKGAAKAVDIPEPLLFHDIDAAYDRGLFQLDAGDPAAAAQSFRAVLARHGFGYVTPYDLARLGLARALRRSGDLAGSRAAYEDFLAAWRDADPDLPVRKAAQAEYKGLSTVEPKPAKPPHF